MCIRDRPRGGYIKRKDFTCITLEDGIELNSQENIHPSLIGLVIDYMTRFCMGTPKETAFHISILLSLIHIFAEQAMVSKSTALNLFRKYLHITPVNYLINYRLKQAGQLLSKTEKKVNLISSETGFHNVDYFCRLFKKRYKLTPTEYRKQKHFL